MTTFGSLQSLFTDSTDNRIIMSIPKQYKYKIPPRQDEDLDLHRLEPVSNPADPIPLNGWVHGKKASDLEERFARALNKLALEYWFQVKVYVATSPPGGGKRVDFAVDLGIWYPVEVDGPLGHSTAAQQGRDEVREMLLNAVFRHMCWAPLRRVKWWQLETQEMTDRIVREMFS